MRERHWLAAFLVIIAAGSAWAQQVDLTRATVVTGSHLSRQELKAVTMLVEEVEKRTGIRWPAANAPRHGPQIEIRSPASGPAEGYHIQVRDNSVELTGNDARGVLFGIGRLLRGVHMQPGRVTVDADWNETSAPRYRLRGHQLGYRPKTNSYDGWPVPLWEQYIRDLAVFGTNAIELIPPRSDDAPDSPHFPLPPMQMMIEMSRLADDYGLDVWIWYPAMDRDYSDPKTVAAALEEWGEVFRKLPRVDAVFVPGGDPGRTEPKVLTAFLEKESAVLRRSHPKAQMWVSPQGFDQEWLDQFYGILQHEQPAWLNGVVYGPQVRAGLPQLRAAIPARYPIRLYPDITHSRQCQYPVPDWDTAYAVTEAREVINPRPFGEAEIFRRTAPYTIGFLAYSEGCNDDVNKIVWSALAWNPDAKVETILREFGRYFIGDRYGENFAEGLEALERNWQGPLSANDPVDRTLAAFQELERAATPQMLLNWRFQQALYRAYYDAYTRRRLLYETGLENRAMNVLRRASSEGSEHAMSEAESVLGEATARHVAEDWRTRIFSLAEALFQSIRMQLSVRLYKAISVDRGATLDTVDAPLNNRLWLAQRFRELREQPEAERQAGIQQILNWTDPGPGGFYDDLGDITRQPHLVRGEGTFAGFGPSGTRRRSWWDHAEALYDAPLRMHYSGLDPQARYKIRMTYAGDSPRRKLRLVAGERWQVHPLMEKPSPVWPVEFDIPHEATERGELDLTWTGEPGLGGNGRGCQVSEVWLIKK